MNVNTRSLNRVAVKAGAIGLMFLSACASPTFRILEKPIVFDEERKQLSLEYLKARYNMQKDAPYIEPKMIVLHWTAIPTLEKSFNAMNPTLLPGSRTAIGSASSLNVSAQFLVDRDGTVYRQLPDTAFARHVIGLNHCAIGVENVGGGKEGLTKAQLKANVELVRYLKSKYDIEYLIGHYEYQDFVGHHLWKEVDAGYRTKKVDPGKDFMRKVRIKTKDLELKGSPQS
ncbi:N-acetylmuramoyl-L-alanine amidase [Pontibacter anaerobius]|uniref:N-acetylmuramoyl-L-alanine amidase n=1 Tax=Pontibacter anaerobius TaxID=2993940 RepID=A0ABT3RG12_9BACT|nr:peptidoglycan recognition family protein [Pontibacter anaerobius]MCX2740376.1 peptidoglycan recognition family protein [Pontibacter anaerobius]